MEGSGRPTTRPRPAPGPTLALGSRAGRYRIVGEIGRGGMGRVYLAYDPELDREVAIKVLAIAKGEERAAYARLQREAQALARLGHPNAVEIYDVQATEAPLFIAMEYVPGTNLHEWITGTVRDVAQILGVFVQAGRGLAAAHAAGLVHRDFKPSNVLVRDDGRVKVTDFGLARGASSSEGGIAALTSARSVDDGILGEDLTRSGTVVGTPPYMSPEQQSGESTDARSDQYSFCVALYEALVGRRPFQQTEARAMLEAKRRGRPSPPPSRRAARCLRAG